MVAERLIARLDADMAREHELMQRLIEDQKEYVKVHFDPS